MQEGEGVWLEPDALGASLLALWEDGAGADFVIRCADGDVDAHASILEARSAFARRTLARTPGLRNLRCNGVDQNTLRACLCFCYADCLVGSYADVLEDPQRTATLLACGRTFGVDGLEEWVEAALIATLSVETLAARVKAVGPEYAPLWRLKALREATVGFALGCARKAPELAQHALRSRPADPALRSALEATLAGQLTPESLASNLRLATALDAEALREACMAYARTHLSKVMCDPDFAELLKERSDLVFELLTALDGEKAGK